MKLRSLKVLILALVALGTPVIGNLSATPAFATAGLDTTFNPMGSTPGTVATAFGSKIPRDSYANSMVIDGDGKIVAAGASGESDDSYNFLVARYNADGSLDTTFNTSGETPGSVFTAIGSSTPGESYINSVKIQ